MFSVTVLVRKARAVSKTNGRLYLIPWPSNFQVSPFYFHNPIGVIFVAFVLFMKGESNYLIESRPSKVKIQSSSFLENISVIPHGPGINGVPAIVLSVISGSVTAGSE